MPKWEGGLSVPALFSSHRSFITFLGTKRMLPFSTEFYFGVFSAYLFHYFITTAFI